MSYSHLTDCLLQGNDYEHHVRQNVFKFMQEKLGVPPEEAVPVWQKAFAMYNQTLKGLRESGFTFDVDEYWDYIRAGAENFLSPDPQVSHQPHHSGLQLCLGVTSLIICAHRKIVSMLRAPNLP